jgi:hypothetical protein
MCFPDLCKIFVWNISQSKKNWAGKSKNKYRSLCNIPVIFSNFNVTWIFLTDLLQHSNIKYHENSSDWNRIVHTDGQTKRI